MATREENLKKINAELEQLSDEDLEEIAGGRLVRTAEVIKSWYGDANGNIKISSELPNNTTYGFKW